ncbi:MAG: hypothetical protein ACE15E_18120 [Acidobacteriota bacterium]
MTDIRNDKCGFGERGRPALAPDDYRRRRRGRRLKRTLQAEAAVRAWAQKHGLALRVLNGGHHWIFEKAGLVAEWWPSSAKLALNRDYLRTFHAPHWPDVEAVLERSAVG